MVKRRTPLFSVTRDDLDVQTFRAGGKGGQNQNKRDTGVRIIHRASGAVGEARDERSQAQNRRLAFRRMVQSRVFHAWVMRKAAEIGSRRTLEQEVEATMAPCNLRVEVRDPAGRWVPDGV